MTVDVRRAQRGVGALLVALTVVLCWAASAARADTIYPDNKITGTSFDTGLDGWTEFTNSCDLLRLFDGAVLDLGAPPPLCDPRTEHAAGSGTPPGSLQQSSRQAAGVGLIGPLAEVIRGHATVLSPTFTIATDGAARFDVDVRGQVKALVDLGLFDPAAQAHYTFTLVDQGNGNRTTLLDDTLDRDHGFNTSGAFSGRVGESAAIDDAVQAGHSYRIELQTTFQSNPDNLASAVGVLSEITAQFDNVRLRIADGTPTFGPATAITDDATDITATTATLNGRTNAQGLPSTYRFRYGVSGGPLNQSTPAAADPGFDAGTGITLQPRSRPVTGLTACTTYDVQIEATNERGTGLGGIKSFRTDCAPTATTDPAIVGSTTASLNSTINPNGSDTRYFYEYGLDSAPAGTFANRVPVAGAEPSIGEGNAVVQPNSQVIEGLTPETTYRFRVIAVNAVGTTTANTRTFTTNGLGATGPTGPTGPQGTAGTNGTNGTNGVTGPQGPQGAPGTPGARGPLGPRGPQGTGPSGSSIQDLLSTDKRAMIRIDARRLSVPRRGRDTGRVRVAIYCRRVAVRTCSGNMKVRSIARINPASSGSRPKRRVTFATAPVQLDEGKKGFAILDFNSQRRGVLRRQGSVRVSIIVSVIDADNNRQNVRRNASVRLKK